VGKTTDVLEVAESQPATRKLETTNAEAEKEPETTVEDARDWCWDEQSLPPLVGWGPNRAGVWGPPEIKRVKKRRSGSEIQQGESNPCGAFCEVEAASREETQKRSGAKTQPAQYSETELLLRDAALQIALSGSSDMEELNGQIAFVQKALNRSEKNVESGPDEEEDVEYWGNLISSLPT
jgi:hypothetical protein